MGSGWRGQTCRRKYDRRTHRLRTYGWIVPAYTMPSNAEEISVLRLVVREDFSMDMAENFIDDVKKVIAELEANPVKANPEQSGVNGVC